VERGLFSLIFGLVGVFKAFEGMEDHDGLVPGELAGALAGGIVRLRSRVALFAVVPSNSPKVSLASLTRLPASSTVVASRIGRPRSSRRRLSFGSDGERRLAAEERTGG